MGKDHSKLISLGCMSVVKKFCTFPGDDSLVVKIALMGLEILNIDDSVPERTTKVKV